MLRSTFHPVLESQVAYHTKFLYLSVFISLILDISIKSIFYSFFNSANLYLLNITDIPEKLADIDEMIGNLTTHLSQDNRLSENTEFVNVKIDSFIPSFKEFVMDKKNLTHRKNKNIRYLLDDENEFRSYLSEFLFTPGIGMKSNWMKSFVLSSNESLNCGEKIPMIEAINFKIENIQ